MNLFLQIFLFFDAFILGVAATLALRHGLAHFKPEKHDAEKSMTANGHLSPEVKKQLQERATTNFENIIDKYSTQLQKDLRASEDNLHAGMEKLSAALVKLETDRFQAELTKLRQEAETADKTTETALGEEKAKLEADLKAAIEAEKQKRIALLDTKIADAVTSFLLEALGHEADLGAQEKYLLSQLETHKAEIIKGVTDAS